MHDGMSVIIRSINSRECILNRQCQFNKVDRMISSTNYFRQIIVFLLFFLLSFAKSYVKLQYFVTTLSLVTLRGRVCTHKPGEMDSFNTLFGVLLQLYTNI